MIYLYWLLPIPVLISVLVLMYRRKQHHLYPVFWSYLFFQCVRLTADALSFASSHKAYFYTYWIGTVCSILLSLLLLRSIFVTVLHGYHSLSRIRAVGYEIALACAWIIGTLIAVEDAPGHTYLQVIARVWQAVSFTSVGILLFVVVSSSILGIRWKESVCGIAAGLGLLGVVDLLVSAMLSHSWMHLTGTVIGYIETAAYYCAVCIFAFYFVPRRIEDEVLPRIQPELMQWTESMRGAVPR